MLHVIAFELRLRLRQATPYLFFAILLALGFLCYSTEAVNATRGEAVKANAPVTVAVLVAVLTVLGAIMVSGLMGTAILRDFERRTHELYFTTPLRKFQYLVGRFIGSFLVTLLVFSGLPLGMPLGAAMPWVEGARLLPFHPETYLLAYVFVAVPNLLLIGALFFILGAITRRVTTIYTAGVLLFVAYILASVSLQELDNRYLASMLDPFGVRALQEMSRYWTAAEQNINPLVLTGPLLWNRLLWCSVAAVVFAAGYALFRFASQPLFGVGLSRRKRSAGSTDSRTATRQAILTLSFAPAVSFSSAATFLRLSRFYFVQILRSVTFQVILLTGMITVFVAASHADQIFETPVYPITRLMVTEIGETFAVFYLIMITFYAGELIWRERALRVDQLTDTLPIPTVQLCLSKIVAVLALVAVLNVCLVFAGVAT